MHQTREAPHVLHFPCAMDGIRARCFLNGVAERRSLNYGQGEFGLPLQLPDFAERSLSAACVRYDAPWDAQELEPVQETTPGEVVLLAEIEFQRLFCRTDLESK